ncbi:MAG TPA: spermidine/putrescine ABC transporter substrate-binding protein [Herpetosiphonaceae bacterium]|nr:spermidine/putrescine ABC transporter substrate-binding protein [Herpetosiphonaceae bacterium]
MFPWLLSGCNSISPPAMLSSLPEQPMDGMLVDRQRMSSTLMIYGWFNYMDPQILRDFTAEYGTQVKVETYDDADTVRHHLQANPLRYDLVILVDYMSDQLQQEGLLGALELGSMPNIGNIGGFYLDLANPATSQPSATIAPPTERQRPSCIPYMWGTAGIAYNSDIIQTPVDSWNFLLKPDPALHGKISMLNDQRDAIGAALKSLGYSINTQNPDELARAEAVLQAQRPFLSGYASDMVLERLSEGELVAAQVWTGMALRAAEQRPGIKYVIPKEGSSIFQDNICLLANSSHAYTASVFLNYLNRPEIAARLTTYTRYATPNDSARALLEPDLQANPALYPPPEIRMNLERIRSVGEADDAYNQIWSRLVTQK